MQKQPYNQLSVTPVRCNFFNLSHLYCKCYNTGVEIKNRPSVFTTQSIVDTEPIYSVHLPVMTRFVKGAQLCENQVMKLTTL
ncbi:hypothetical protein Pse7367_0311 [Thalassoporum mexicanum PCC 7367]|nr:hypothetical protein Pse7367_0311 [Pseudanabaena sp. PCC 7367]